jgi:hypothetical protein
MTAPIIEHIEEKDDTMKDYTYLSQFDRETDGLRLNEDIVWDRMRNIYGKEHVWGDIGGERQMRGYADTDVLEGTLTRESFETGLSTAELNDLMNYHGWNIYSWLALRATEGESELIPRQEYETVSTAWSFLRYPEFYSLLIDEYGIDGLIDMGVNARDELGTAVNHLISWCNFVVPGFGSIALESLEYIDPDDPIIADKKRTVYSGCAALAFGLQGENGYIRASQNRFVNHEKSSKVIDFLRDRVTPIEDTERAKFRRFNASIELFSFLMHYDNRVGLSDSGPYLQDDGKLMLVRDIFVDREFLPSRIILDQYDFPRAFSLAIVLDPSEVDLEEIRVGIGTVTEPANYLEGAEAVAVFARDADEQFEPLPLSELDQLTFDDMSAYASQADEAVQDWYQHTTRLPRRDKIMNGARVYYVGMLYPLLKTAGLYDRACDELDLWELHPMISDAYYETMGDMAQEFIPANIMFGYGWNEIPDEPAEESGYAEWLAEHREKGWHSDLTGMLEPSEDLRSRMDENHLLDVPVTKTRE